MAKYDKATAQALVQELTAVAGDLARAIANTPEASEDLIDHHCENINTALAILKTTLS